MLERDREMELFMFWEFGEAPRDESKRCASLGAKPIGSSGTDDEIDVTSGLIDLDGPCDA